jgi:hypothetical protein
MVADLAKSMTSQLAAGFGVNLSQGPAGEALSNPDRASNSMAPHPPADCGLNTTVDAHLINGSNGQLCCLPPGAQSCFCNHLPPSAGFAGSLLQSQWVQQLMGPALGSLLGIDAGGIAAILSGTSGLTPEQMVTRMLSLTAKVNLYPLESVACFTVCEALSGRMG